MGLLMLARSSRKSAAPVCPEIGVPGGQRQSHKTTETVTDNHRLFELVLADVVRQAVADAVEHGRGHAGNAGEAGDGEHVALKAVLVVGHGGVPGLAGRGKPRDEDHSWAMTGDLDVKWILGQQAEGEAERNEERFHD